MKTLLLVLIVFALNFGFSFELTAQTEVKANGSGHYVIELVHSEKLKDGTMMNRLYYKGTILTDLAEQDESIQDCYGTAIVDAEGNLIWANGYCDGLDKDGDVWMISWDSSPDGTGTWRMTGGTGKWKSVTGGGTTQQGANYVDRSFISWEGTYIMPN